MEDVKALAEAGAEIRGWISAAALPPRLEKEIRAHYTKLAAGSDASFAVRSSATAEDLPDASFAGQQETFLNIHGIDNILHAIKEVFASLYNDRAISYRVHKAIRIRHVALSAGVQRMVRSDMGASGVMFTIDTESGFRDVVFITASYGLGEMVVQGAVNPDEFYVHKPSWPPASLRCSAAASAPSSSAWCSTKNCRRTFHQYRGSAQTERNSFSLNDDEVLELARYAMVIEQHYGRPMDIEWGKDGIDGKLYILQARPETVKSQVVQAVRKNSAQIRQGADRRPRDRPEDRHRAGAPGGQHRRDGQGSGRRYPGHRHDRPQLGAGDEKGLRHHHQPRRAHLPCRHHRAGTGHPGHRRLRRCHRACSRKTRSSPLLARKATPVSCMKASCLSRSPGRMKAALPLPVKFMINVGNPDLAFDFAQMPSAGIGLARLEFVINNLIGIHPKAVLQPQNLLQTSRPPC